MIVVDTNIIAALTLPHPDRELVATVWQHERIWYAPCLWLPEWKNVALRYVRHKLATLPTIEAALALAEEAVPTTHRLHPDNILTLRIANRTSLSAYDAEFLATAELLDVPLVTMDKGLVAAGKGRAVTPAEFVG